jgi:hypothetical protein
LVPHDERTSGTPGCHSVFFLTNHGERPVEVCLAALLVNPIRYGAVRRDLDNRVVADGDATHLILGTVADDDGWPTHGGLVLSMGGARASWITGELTAYSACFHHHAQSEMGHPHHGALLDLWRDGRLPSLPGGRIPSDLLTEDDAALAALPDSGLAERIARACAYPCFHAIWRRLQMVDPELATSRHGQEIFCREVRSLLNRFLGATRDDQDWGDAALAGDLVLGPGETREVAFGLAWHFPNHVSEGGTRIGHRYQEWFPDALAVARFLVAGRTEHRAVAASFADALFATNLPAVFPRAWSAQLATLIKSSWWSRAGDFGIWEGLGCCGLHTTDISYYASFPIAALFPALELRQMAMTAARQRPDGRMPHMFYPDLEQVDAGFDRVDMNQQFVQMVYRDHGWTGDDAFAARLWPQVVLAMEAIAALDGDGDGLPDTGTRLNTFDCWDFRGAPLYLADLWLGALVCAIRLAKALGHEDEARRWTGRLTQATASLEGRLWNGSHYSCWVDGDLRDEGVMAAALSGSWFNACLGLPGHLDPARVRTYLQTVLRIGFDPSMGLRNGAYPGGAAPRLQSHGNMQAESTWSGVEYAFAAQCLSLGMVAEAESIVTAVERRFQRAGRTWNHNECGDHYYRAMSAWSLLLCATGFSWDARAGSLRFAPADGIGILRAPWATPTAWGTVSLAPGRCELHLLGGHLALRELRLPQPPDRLTCANRPVACIRDGTTLRFVHQTILVTGDRLVDRSASGE